MNSSAYYQSFDYRLRRCLLEQLACPVRPLPIQAVYLQLCHPFRVVTDLYHTSSHRRRVKLHSALRFLRRHNVLLHSLLFYVPETATWNTTEEFSRLRLYGEAYLHSELRTRLLKLLPTVKQDLYTEVLLRSSSETCYAMLFDMLEMSTLVGSKPVKPPRLVTKKRGGMPNPKNSLESSAEITDKLDGGRPSGSSNPFDGSNERKEGANRILKKKRQRIRVIPTEASRGKLQSQRRQYRAEYTLTPHQKASMLCAVLGELRWFAARTRPAYRTHNNAIFPPSDVLILHVLATHLVECIPAEMLFVELQPHLEAIWTSWRNKDLSLPGQLKKRLSIVPSKQYRLHSKPQPAFPQEELQYQKEGGGRTKACEWHLKTTTAPVKDAILSTMTPQIIVKEIKGGVNSAQYRFFIHPRKQLERDSLLTLTAKKKSSTPLEENDKVNKTFRPSHELG